MASFPGYFPGCSIGGLAGCPVAWILVIIWFRMMSKLSERHHNTLSVLTGAGRNQQKNLSNAPGAEF